MKVAASGNIENFMLINSDESFDHGAGSGEVINDKGVNGKIIAVVESNDANPTIFFQTFNESDLSFDIGKYLFSGGAFEAHVGGVETSFHNRVAVVGVFNGGSMFT